MNTGIIVAMASVTVASAIAEKVLISIGRADEATYLNFTTKSGIATTAISIFAKLIVDIKKL